MRSSYNRVIVRSDSGEVVPFAYVEVRVQSTNSLAVIYNVIEGGTPILNPMTADANGVISFFTDVGFYKIIAKESEFGPDVATLNYESVVNPFATEGNGAWGATAVANHNPQYMFESGLYNSSVGIATNIPTDGASGERATIAMRQSVGPGGRSFYLHMDRDGTGWFMYRTSPDIEDIGTWYKVFERLKKNNLTATTNPGVNDDASEGYSPLSLWINTSTSEIWQCIANTEGAAHWEQGTITLDDLGNLAVVNANTVGLNLVQLSNPSAVRYIRINADNTVSLLSDSDLRTAIGAGTGNGSVTSVTMTVPTGLSVSGGPITGSGTLAVTLTSGYSIPTTAKQTEWDSAYSQRLQWDGGSTNLDAATGRSSLNLGTAATGNIVTSSTDTTAGRLPTVGWRGVGGSAVNISWSTPGGGAFIAATGLNASNPSNVYYGIHSGSSDNQYGFQIGGRGSEIFFRTIEAGVVSATHKVYTSYNVSSSILTFMNSGTTGAMRTNIGATPVGSNIMTLANPNAIRYLRINADNTVTALSGDDLIDELELFTNTNIGEKWTVIGDNFALPNFAASDYRTAISRAINLRTLDANETIDTDDNQNLYLNSTGTSPTFTIPNDATVTTYIGCRIRVINNGAGTITVARGSGVTLYTSGTSANANRSIGAYGNAWLEKIGADTWYISGNGVS